MRFTVSAVLAMAASAFAQTADFDPIYTPESNAVIEAGSTFEVTWAAPAKYADGTVSIHLIGGATQNTQVPLLDIATGVPNSANKYSWTVGADLGEAAVYGLVFKYESDPSIFQYSNPFHIKAAASKPSSTSAAASESAATTVTTSTGAVTVTLSSCTTSETPVVSSSETPIFITSSPVPTYSAPVVIPSSAPVHQNSTLVTVKPVVPSTSVAVVNPPTVPTSQVTPPPASAASGRSVSGALALVAGVAVAMLTL